MTSDVAPHGIRPSLALSRRLRWGGAILLLLAGLAVYSSSFSGSFVLDDHRTILNSVRIRQLLPLSDWQSQLAGLLSGRRPVVDATLAINYAVGELNVVGYHVVNLLIHLLAGLTLYGIVGRTLSREPLRTRFHVASPYIAITVALLWIVHPLQTQSVTYLIQRSESLMGLFYLLTLYCLIRGAASTRAWAWYVAGTITCALGFGCKAVMLTAPVAVLLYDRAFVSRSLTETFRLRWRFYLALAATWSALWCTSVAQSVLATDKTRATVGFSFHGISPLDYLLTQAGVIAHYLRLSLWPQPLCLDYGWPVAQTLGAIVPAGLLVVFLLGATVWACLRRPALGYAGAWFFLILSPTSSFVPIRDPAFEHRMYLPLAAVIVVAVCGAFALGAAVAARLAVNDRVRRAAAGCVVACAALSLGAVTYQRNEVYRSELAAWQDVVAKRPQNHRGQYNLGKILLDADRLDEAARALELAIRIDPDGEKALYNLGKTRARQGKPDEAMRWYNDALRVNPNMGQAHSDIGNILARRGLFAESIERYEEAIRVEPTYVRAYANLGNVLLGRQLPAEAVDVLRTAVGIDPGEARIRYLLGSALLAMGAVPEAIAEFRVTLELDPSHARAPAALDEARRRLDGSSPP